MTALAQGDEVVHVELALGVICQWHDVVNLGGNAAALQADRVAPEEPQSEPLPPSIIAPSSRALTVVGGAPGSLPVHGLMDGWSVRHHALAFTLRNAGPGGVGSMPTAVNRIVALWITRCTALGVTPRHSAMATIATPSPQCWRMMVRWRSVSCGILPSHMR